MSKITIDKSIYDFWVGFHPTCAKNYPKELCEWAAKKGYLDMCRTLHFGKTDHASLLGSAITCIYESCGTFQPPFSAWHQKLCEALIDQYHDFDMTYGQAQKWVNMTIKYIWLVYTGCNTDLDYYVELMKCPGDFHVPLDSIILRYVKKHINKPADSAELLPIAPEKAAFLKEEANLPWSRWNDYEKYLQYQSILKQALQKDPLDWELTHWIKAIAENK